MPHVAAEERQVRHTNEGLTITCSLALVAIVRAVRARCRRRQHDNRVLRSFVPYLGGGDCAATAAGGTGTREGSGGLCERRSACVASGPRARRWSRCAWPGAACPAR